MKATLCTIFFLACVAVAGFSQSPQAYFNSSASLYVNGKNPEALASVTAGLKKYPSDSKLKALYDKLTQEKKEQEKKGQQEKKDQQNKDKQDQEKKDQQEQDQQKKDQKEQDQTFDPRTQ